MFAYVNDESCALPTAPRRPWHPNDIDKCTVVEDDDEVVLLDEANFALKG